MRAIQLKADENLEEYINLDEFFSKITAIYYPIFSDEKATPLLIESLKRNQTIKKINLWFPTNEHITEYLTDYLAASTSIVELDLVTSRNARDTLEPLSMDRIARGVLLNQSNYLDDGGVGMLLRELTANPPLKLKNLSLAQTWITNQIIPELIQFLLKNNEMESINLNFNSIGDEGLKILLEELIANPQIKLKKLYIGFAGLSKKSAPEIKNFLNQKNQMLEIIFDDFLKRELAEDELLEDELLEEELSEEELSEEELSEEEKQEKSNYNSNLFFSLSNQPKQNTNITQEKGITLK